MRWLDKKLPYHSNIDEANGTSEKWSLWVHTDFYPVKLTQRTLSKLAPHLNKNYRLS